MTKATTDPHLSAIQTIFKLLGVAPKVYERVQQWKGEPTKEDRERLVRYCRRLDERRVFSAPFNSEVEESCVGSQVARLSWARPVAATTA